MSNPFEQRDFQPSDLDSLKKIFLLTPDDPLDTFAEIWYQLFIWSFTSSFLIYIFAAGYAFKSLRKHKIARFWPVVILFAGLVTSLILYLITSASIAAIYRAANFQMPPLYALIFWRWSGGHYFNICLYSDFGNFID